MQSATLMRIKSAMSLTAISVLCLPSLVGGLALLTNVALGKHMGNWGEASAAFVALGVFVGGPLVAAATVIGLLVACHPLISSRVKGAHLTVVVLGAIATTALLFRFANWSP